MITVERALARLQALIRRPPVGDARQTAMTRRLPADLAGEVTQHLGLLADEVDAMRDAVAALLADLRFEHLRDPEARVWRFAAAAWLEPTTDHLRSFVAEHEQTPLNSVCYLPVEFLKVNAELEVLGIRLLPVDDLRIPPAGGWFSLASPVGCVAAVETGGTSPGRMAERARQQAVHSLRALRIALREDRGVHDRQLRFRLSTTYAFDKHLSGWSERDDDADDLTLGGDGIKVIHDQPIARMPLHPTTDIGKKADLALRWMERAWLAGDPLVALLYLFFALEGLLGDKSEGLKAHGLAFRQTMLSYVATGGFGHPNEIWFLYDQVRSSAVHGEIAPEISSDVVRSFAGNVRATLNNYLNVAGQHGLTKRGRLLAVLDYHADRSQLVAWLRTHGGPIWTTYLDRLEGAGPC
ncbi:MAG TPA: hypothetical protein VFX16_30360 [Pseudonocardiaceae bacterium]|nr:hypothetical protein [Pseudonocardiaceae bacterium]